MVCTRCGEPLARDASVCGGCGAVLEVIDLPIDLSGTGIEHSDPRLPRMLASFILAGLLAATAVWFTTRSIVNSFGHGLRLAAVASPTPRLPTPALPQRPRPSASQMVVLPRGDEHAAALPSTAKVCSSTVGGTSTTPCTLARAVAAALPKQPQGAFQLTVTDPADGESHTLACTAGRMVVCSRGTAINVFVLY